MRSEIPLLRVSWNVSRMGVLHCRSNASCPCARGDDRARGSFNGQELVAIGRATICVARDKNCTTFGISWSQNSFYRIYLRRLLFSSGGVVWPSSRGGDCLWLRAHPSRPTPGLRSARGISSPSTQFLEIGQNPTPDATHCSSGVSLAGSSRAFSFHRHGPLSQTT